MSAPLPILVQDALPGDRLRFPTSELTIRVRSVRILPEKPSTVELGLVGLGEILVDRDKRVEVLTQSRAAKRVRRMR